MADETPLSEREVDIMRQLVTGASNREIARALDISPNTVKVHLRNIYEKLGVASRTEATLVVLREGWIEVEGVVAAEEEEEEAPPPPNGLMPVAQAEPGVVALPFPEQPEPLEHRPAALRPLRPSFLMMALLGLTVLLLLAILGVLLFRPTVPTTVTVEEPTRWQQLAQLPAPRAGAAAIGVGSTFYLLGGQDAEEVQDEFWHYDTAQGRWRTLPPLPQAARAVAVALVGGDLFVVGGLDSDGQPLDLLQRYDLRQEEWHEASLPQPLAHAALVAFEGELYLFGGWDGQEVQDTIYHYSREGEWQPLQSLPEPRMNLAAVAVQDGIVLVGGRDQAGNPTRDVWHFDPRGDEGVRPEAPLPTHEAAPRLVALGSALYLLGQEGLWERDPERRWHPLSLPEAVIPHEAALVASDPYIILLGGIKGDHPVQSVWQYQALYRSFVPLLPGGEP